MDAIVLRGRTVTLRLLSLADATALAPAASESRAQYVYTRVPDGVEHAKRYIETALADHEVGRRIAFAIIWHDRTVGSPSHPGGQHWRWSPGSPLQRDDRPD